GVRRAQRGQHADPAQIGGSHRQHSTRDCDGLMADPVIAKAKTKAAEPAQPASMMAVIAPAVGWLIPGAGHIIQRRWIRGALLFISIATLFVLGLLMQGHI